MYFLYHYFLNYFVLGTDLISKFEIVYCKLILKIFKNSLIIRNVSKMSINSMYYIFSYKYFSYVIFYIYI